MNGRSWHLRVKRIIEQMQSERRDAGQDRVPNANEKERTIETIDLTTNCGRRLIWNISLINLLPFAKAVAC